MEITVEGLAIYVFPITPSGGNLIAQSTFCAASKYYLFDLVLFC